MKFKHTITLNARDVYDLLRAIANDAQGGPMLRELQATKSLSKSGLVTGENVRNSLYEIEAAFEQQCEAKRIRAFKDLGVEKERLFIVLPIDEVAKFCLNWSSSERRAYETPDMARDAAEVRVKERATPFVVIGFNPFSISVSLDEENPTPGHYHVQSRICFVDLDLSTLQIVP